MELMLFQRRVQVRQIRSKPKIKFNYLNPHPQNVKALNLSVNRHCQNQFIDAEYRPQHLQYIKTSTLQPIKRMRRNRIFDSTITLSRSNDDNIVLRQRSMEVRRRVMEGKRIYGNISKKVRKSIFSHHSQNNKGYFTRNPSLICDATKSIKNNKTKNNSKSLYFESQMYRLAKQPSLNNFLMKGIENNGQKESQQKGNHSSIHVQFSDQHLMPVRSHHDQGNSHLLIDSQGFQGKNISEDSQKLNNTNRQTIRIHQRPVMSIQNSNNLSVFAFRIELFIVFMGFSLFLLQIIK